MSIIESMEKWVIDTYQSPIGTVTEMTIKISPEQMLRLQRECRESLEYPTKEFNSLVKITLEVDYGRK